MENEKNNPNTQLKVLLIAANPSRAFASQLEQESAEIVAAFRSDNPDATITVRAVGVGSDAQLLDALQGGWPDILHFSTIGSSKGNVLLQNAGGKERNLSGVTLAKIISQTTSRPRCIFFCGSTVARQIDALSVMVESIVSFKNRRFSADYSSLISRLFYSHQNSRYDFFASFRATVESIENLGVSSIFQAKFISRTRPTASAYSLSVDDATYSPDLADASDYGAVAFSRARLDGAFGAPVAVQREVKEKPPNARSYRVWFGTNRKPNYDKGIVSGFSADRDDRTHYGHCDVAIPEHHTIGSVGDPWWKRFPKFWRNNQLSLQKLDVQAEGVFWGSIQSFFNALPCDQRVLLVYVHGYKTSFDDAALRSAQLGFDLNVPGATAFFSWPSKGHFFGYSADEATIDASELALEDFILKMASQSASEKVHLIVHSMGNRGMIRALSNMINRIAVSSKVTFGQIFLAAPDVDIGLFRNLAHVYQDMSDRTTLYVSQKDKALMSSGLVHDYPRAGYAPPITVVTGVDTVEVTKIDLTFLGHGYVAEARDVLQDMHALMTSGKSPAERFGLVPKTLSNGDVYWCFSA